MSDSNKNSIAALHALEKHLREQEEHGVDSVHLSATAITDLNSLSAAVATAAPKPPPPPPKAEPKPIPKAEPKPAPAPSKPAAPATPQEPPTEKRLQLRELAIRAKKCEATRALGSLRQQLVFADGNPDADLMFVGEAPGAEDEKKKRPFNGPAGQLLEKIIGAMGLTREQVYLSNIVKFRPSTGDENQGAHNRKPTPEEMATSVKYIIDEINIVEPKVIVALGGTAMEGLLGLSGSVTEQRSKFHTLRGVPVMVTYHPSHLIRSGETSEKRKVWEDLLLVMEKLGMPISPKQRSYFL